MNVEEDQQFMEFMEIRLFGSFQSNMYTVDWVIDFFSNISPLNFFF